MNRKDRSSAQRMCKLALALAAAWLSTAHAETSPWYIGARETITRDSNVFRTTSAQSDTIFSTGLFGGLDQQIGRQRLRGNLAANWNRYREVDALNHTDGSAGLRLDWETVEHLSGDLQVNHRRSLYRDFAQSVEAQKIIVNTTDAAFNARLGVVTAWTLEAGAFGSRTRFDAPLSTSNIDYDGYRAGVRYAESSLLALGLGYRHTRGEYPKAAVSANDFDRDDIDLTLGWNPNDISSFAGRVSRTKLHYPNLSERSSALTTGQLDYKLRPGGRLSLDASLQRDNNAGQSISDLVVDVGGGGLALGSQLSADARVSTTTAVAAHYELTGKVQLGLDLRHVDRKLDSTLTDTLLNGQATVIPRSANDRTDSVGLNATYDPTRTLRLSCGVTRIKRRVGGPDAATLTYPYSVNLTSCMAQLALQP